MGWTNDTAEMEAVHLVNRWTNTGRQRLNTLLATIVVSAYYLNSIGYVLHSYSHLPLLYMYGAFTINMDEEAYTHCPLQSVVSPCKVYRTKGTREAAG